MALQASKYRDIVASQPLMIIPQNQNDSPNQGGEQGKKRKKKGGSRKRSVNKRPRVASTSVSEASGETTLRVRRRRRTRAEMDDTSPKKMSLRQMSVKLGVIKPMIIPRTVEVAKDPQIHKNEVNRILFVCALGLLPNPEEQGFPVDPKSVQSSPVPDENESYGSEKSYREQDDYVPYDSDYSTKLKKAIATARKIRVVENAILNMSLGIEELASNHDLQIMPINYAEAVDSAEKMKMPSSISKTIKRRQTKKCPLPPLIIGQGEEKAPTFVPPISAGILRRGKSHAIKKTAQRIQPKPGVSNSAVTLKCKRTRTKRVKNGQKKVKVVASIDSLMQTIDEVARGIVVSVPEAPKIQIVDPFKARKYYRRVVNGFISSATFNPKGFTFHPEK